MRYLAIDLGSHMGFAFDVPFRTMAGTVNLATDAMLRTAKATRADRRLDVRAGAMYRWLNELLHRHGPPDVLVFEDVQFAKSQAQAHLWASFRGVLWSVALLHAVPRVDCIATGKLKIFATGHGHADKDDMALALLKREPVQFSRTPSGLKQLSTGSILDDNAIDAYFLLRWAQSVYDKP